MNRFRLLGNATLIVVGLLALVAISPVGQGIATLAAISVIGIPIAFLIVALPSVFLVLLALRLAVEAWNRFRSGNIPLAIGFAIALLLMADFFVFRAWRVNRWLDSRVAALVARDIDEAGATGPIGLLAVLRNTRSASDTTNPCDDLCRRLLLTGAAKQVLALTAAPAVQPRSKARKTMGLPEWPALEPDAQMSGTAWRLEARDHCADPALTKTSRHVNVPERARPSGAPYVPAISSEELLRLRIAAGTCLVSEEMPLVQADALLAYGTLNSGLSGYRAGYDAWADTISAWRISFWRNEGGRLEERYRRTGVAWSKLPWLLIPTINPGAELRTKGGWARTADARNRARYESEPPIGAFVVDKLGLALQLKVDPEASSIDQQTGLRVEQAKAVDRALAAGVPSSDVEAKVLADYLDSVGSPFKRRSNGADAEDAERVARVLEQRRIALSSQAAGASRFAVETTPSLSARLAVALVDRLEALPPPTDGNGTRSSWDEQIRTITSSLAHLPAPALAPYRAQAVSLMRDRERRVAATTLLGRLDLFGPTIAPDIFAMMDDAVMLRETRGRELSHLRRNWAEIWRAGARSICRMAPELTGLADALRSRAHALALQQVHVADAYVVAALLRMNVAEDDIRDTLYVEPGDEKAMRSFRFALRRARRDDACR